MTGVKERTANAPNNSVDRSEKASDELAIVFNVWPAWIAKNDGGATPETENKRVNESDHLKLSAFDCSNISIWIDVWISN